MIKYHYDVPAEDYDDEESLEEAIRDHIDVDVLINLLDGRSAFWIFGHLDEDAKRELLEEAIKNEKDDWVVEFDDEEEEDNV